MVNAATGFHCPDCAKSDRKTVPVVRRASTDRIPPATLVLLGLIGLGYVATASLGGAGGGATRLHGDFGMYAPSLADGQWYRVLTHGLLHYGILHLAMNGYALWVLGPIIEGRLGTARFIMLWIVGAAGAAAGAAWLEPTALAAGASGSLFGLLAAAVVLERRRGIRELLGSRMGLWLAYGLVFTFLMPGISIGGHVGGALAGAVAAAFMFEFDRHGTQRFGLLGATAVAILALGLTAIGADHAADALRVPPSQLCALLADQGLTPAELLSIGCP